MRNISILVLGERNILSMKYYFCYYSVINGCHINFPSWQLGFWLKASGPTWRIDGVTIRHSGNLNTTQNPIHPPSRPFFLAQISFKGGRCDAPWRNNRKGKMVKKEMELKFFGSMRRFFRKNSHWIQTNSSSCTFYVQRQKFSCLNICYGGNSHWALGKNTWKMGIFI